MPQCSNPVQCQTAKRPECTCDCLGANHGHLRLLLESENPHEEATGKSLLAELKVAQAAFKKDKKTDRRKKRAEMKKAGG